MIDPIQALIMQAAGGPVAPPVEPVASTDSMVATLRLEAIGDNHTRLARSDFRHVLRQMARVPHEERYAVLTPGRRPWVARITVRPTSRRFDREFVRPMRDYRDANSVGSRGVMLTFVLRAGLYEVNELLSWKNERRYFCRVQSGTLTEITRDEARNAA